MDGDRIAAALIAAGLILFAVAGFATPSGLYQEPDHAMRLRIIDEAQARFLVAQLLWALMLALPAIGFVILSRSLATPVAWLPPLASAAIVAGSVSGITFVVLQTIDPLRYWLNGEGTWASTLSGWLIVAAAALYGIAMIQAPSWGVAGYAVTAYAVVGAVAMLLNAPAFFVLVGFYVVALGPAVVVWQAQPS